jgi:hypothetical protein
MPRNNFVERLSGMRPGGGFHALLVVFSHRHSIAAQLRDGPVSNL